MRRGLRTLACVPKMPPSAIVVPRRCLSSPSKAAEAASNSREESTTVRRLGALLFSGLVGTTACLCSWQMKRYGWKVQLIEDRKTTLALEARPLRELCPDLSAGISADAEYARVVLEGEFDHAQQVLLGPRSAPPGSKTGAPPGAPAPTGWDVITPLTCSDGSRVIVNRGWVPRDATADITRPIGRQRVEGVLKQGDKENKYGVNNLESRRFLWLDLPSLAQHTQSSQVLVVAASDNCAPPARAWPQGRPLDSFMKFHVEPNTHLVYAATWGSLTVAGAFITVKRFLR